MRKHEFCGAVVFMDLGAVQVEVRKLHLHFKPVFLENAVVVLIRCNVHWIEHVNRALKLAVNQIVVGFQLVSHELLQMRVFKI
jgi:hypothetical protein